MHLYTESIKKSISNSSYLYIIHIYIECNSKWEPTKISTNSTGNKTKIKKKRSK